MHIDKIAIVLTCLLLFNAWFGMTMTRVTAAGTIVISDTLAPEEEQRLAGFFHAVQSAGNNPANIRKAISLGEEALTKPIWNNTYHLYAASHLIDLCVKDGQVDKGEKLYWEIMGFGSKNGIENYAAFPTGKGGNVGFLLTNGSATLTQNFIQSSQWNKAWRMIRNWYSYKVFLLDVQPLIAAGEQMPYQREVVKFIEDLLHSGAMADPVDRMLAKAIIAESLLYQGDVSAANKEFDGMDWELYFGTIDLFLGDFKRDTVFHKVDTNIIKSLYATRQMGGDGLIRLCGDALIMIPLRTFHVYSILNDFDRMQKMMNGAHTGLSSTPGKYLAPFIECVITYNMAAGNFAEAEKLLPEYLKALDATGFYINKDEILDAVLASIYIIQERLPEAMPVLVKRFEDNRSRFGPANKGTVDSFHALLQVSTDIKDTKGVADLLQWYEHNRMNLQEANGLILARAYLLAGRQEIARRLLYDEKKKFDTGTYGANFGQVITNYYALAETLHAIGDREEARQWTEKAVKMIVDSASVYTAMPHETAVYLAQYKKIYSLYIKLLQEANLDESGFSAVNLIKGYQLNTIMLQNALENEKVLTPGQLSQIQKFKTAVANCELMASRSMNELERAQWEINKRNAYQQLAEYRRVLFAENPLYRQRSNLPLQPSSIVAGALGEGEVLVDYWLGKGDNSSYAYVLKKHSGLTVVPIRFTDHVRSSLESYRTLIACRPDQRAKLIECWELNEGGYRTIVKNVELPPVNGKRKVENPDEVADYLGNMLIQPLKPYLSEARSLIVSPDGLLATVPLEAFRLNGKYLSEQYNVSYTYSGSLFYNLRQTSQENPWNERSLLAIGAPDFGQDGGVGAPELARYTDRGPGAWSQLTGAKQEISRIAAMFPESQAFMGKAATKEKVYELSTRQQVSKAGIVLFATHGYFDVNEPQRSALVLHGNDKLVALLTAAEIAGLSFPSKLVVLSACETGRGKVVDGVGIIGLPYAFFRAGAENTIITLWAVDDMATADAVSGYFLDLKKSKSFSQAMTKVKRDFINSQSRRDPYYWAPLVLYGQ